jgi:hypothetical protein
LKVGVIVMPVALSLAGIFLWFTGSLRDKKLVSRKDWPGLHFIYNSLLEYLAYLAAQMELHSRRTKLSPKEFCQIICKVTKQI